VRFEAGEVKADGGDKQGRNHDEESLSAGVFQVFSETACEQTHFADVEFDAVVEKLGIVQVRQVVRGIGRGSAAPIDQARNDKAQQEDYQANDPKFCSGMR
jgi:hypothetical protein